MRTLRMGFVTVVALACVSSTAQAQPSFAGTWKLNLAKSQLTGQTLSIEKKPAGQMHFDMQGFAYDFDLSGKDFPTPDGGTSSWREVNPTVWEATNKVNGKAIASYQLTLKGNTIDAVMKATRPDGAAMKQTLAFEKAGSNSIKITTKVAGKPFYVDVLTLSADGKTLTDEGSPVAVKEPMKAVYERQ